MVLLYCSTAPISFSVPMVTRVSPTMQDYTPHPMENSNLYVPVSYPHPPINFPHFAGYPTSIYPYPELAMDNTSWYYGSKPWDKYHYYNNYSQYPPLMPENNAAPAPTSISIKKVPENKAAPAPTSISIKKVPENKAAPVPTSVPIKEEDTTTDSNKAHVVDFILSPQLPDSCNKSWWFPTQSAPPVLVRNEEVREKDILEKQKSNDADENLRQEILMQELQQFMLRGLFVRERNCFYYRSPAEPRDRYGGKAMDEYPIFFCQMPQKPHYQGLLQEGVPEAIKEIVYSSLWFGLVELMRKALETTRLTSENDIDELMRQARGLENLGFDVRHVIARLKQPAISRAEADRAKKELEEARKWKSAADERMKEIKKKEDDERELRKAKGLIKRLVEHDTLISNPWNYIPNPDEDVMQNSKIWKPEYLAQEKENKVRSFDVRFEDS